MDHLRPFVITKLSAIDLEDVRLIGRMKLYAVAHVSGGPSTHNSEYFTTSIDYQGETNPKWKNTHAFRIHDPSLQNNLLNLNIAFYCSRTLGDKYAGGLSVPLKPLFDSISGKANTPQSVRYPVVKSSGGEQGFFNFTFAFGELVAQQRPPPPSQSDYGNSTTSMGDIRGGAQPRRGKPNEEKEDEED